jgi:hypothetical protein
LNLDAAVIARLRSTMHGGRYIFVLVIGRVPSLDPASDTYWLAFTDSK